MLEKKYVGVDLSCWQDTFDAPKAKAAGIDFVMIRAGFGNDPSQVDKNFTKFVDAALAAGMHVGLTWMGYATSVADAVKEAQACKKVITRYSGKIDFPIAYDWEYASDDYFLRINGRRATSAEISDMVAAFCAEMAKGCWYTINYANLDYTFHRLDQSKVGSLDLWLADYVGDPDKTCGIQQTSNSGSIPGISGRVDTDVAYKDYPALIRSLHLNGFVNKTTAPAATTPSVPAVTANTYYTVRPGECMYVIAADHHISLPALLALNPQVKAPDYVIHAGDQIKLSGSTAPAPAPSVPAYRTYTTKSGDCLSVIAEQLLGKGSRYPEIMKLNNMTSDQIGIGQTLKIPNR